MRRAQAEARRVHDLGMEREATLEAARSRARAMALSAQARDAAARLRQTEMLAADTQLRIERLAASRQSLRVRLARDAAVLAAMLPLIERLSLYPAETLLASPQPPGEAMTGLMVLRGLGQQLEADARRVRTEQRELRLVSVSLQAEDHGLLLLRREQAARGGAVEARAEQAASSQRASRDAADDAARQAASSAARAADLQDAVARLEAAEQTAEARFQREAEAADRASRPSIARAARAHAALVAAAAAGPGLAAAAALSAPVAGQLVQNWGAPTDAGPATGIRYAPPGLAVVTAPCEGRIDFAGPFRSYGRMLILDCGRGFRFVLAGLDRLEVTVGQRLAKGAPVGRMPDWSAHEGGGRPSLYVQLRRGSDAVDPTGFLRGRS